MSDQLSRAHLQPLLDFMNAPLSERVQELERRCQTLEQLLESGSTRTPQPMTASDVCRWLKISHATFTKLLEDDPSFPQPRQVGTGPRGKRWVDTEIEAWVSSSADS